MNTSKWIEANACRLTEKSDTIWSYAEPALQENKSSKLLAETLREAGFEVESGVAGLPTAFVATWGTGAPIVAFLGEYDALNGIGLKPNDQMEAPGNSENGHGCGHNLLGVANLGAALALRYELEREGRAGTVRYYGCPAEEIMVGKVRMASAGLFDDVDVALSWHPADVNSVMEEDFLAMQTIRFTFHGLSAHAASAPHLGRSALDAVELMNIGVNYLREHVTDDVRIHYTITNGGGQPNLVPACAESWYYVRAARRQTVDSVLARIIKVAQGGAMMTETECSWETLSGCRHILHNDALEALLHDCMRQISPPQWSQENLRFAGKLLNSIPAGQADAARRLYGGYFEKDAVLDSGVVPLAGMHKQLFNSTDVAEVSWAAPTGQFFTCCAPVGVIHHTWQFTACAGTEIGHRGMLYAAKVLAEAGARLMTEPELLGGVQQDFRRALKNEGIGAASETAEG